MIRSFIAIETPKDIRDGISVLQAHLAKGLCPFESPRKRIRKDGENEGLPLISASGSPVRWVANENLHLTLIFLGEVNEDFLTKAKAQLTGAAKVIKPFDASLNGLGAFPSPRSPRVVWIGMDKGKDETIDLQSKVEKQLGTIGYKPEDRKFHPHLTIGRVKGVIKDAAKIFETNYSSRNFPVNSIVLFRSTLHPEGPVYEKLQEFHFR